MLLFAWLALSISIPVKAANPDIISFQGKVVNSDGTNVSNGTYNFDFVLYDSPTLGAPSDGVHDKWHELTKSVTVTNGVFQTNLGSATPLPDFNANPSLYLAVRFNADAAGYMSPRVQMGSVPYAKNADTVGGVSSNNIVQLGVTQSGNINISSGTLTSGLINGQTISSAANLTGTLKIGGALGAYTLDVNGDINVVSGSAYRLNGVAGANTTCTGGQYLQNPVIAGGITTGGACTAVVTAVTTVGTFSGSSQPNGASIAGNTITFGPADGTNPGMVTTGTQSFAGLKTFSSGLTSATINSTGNTAIGSAGASLTLTGSAASTIVLNGTTVDANEFNLLNGKDAALVDTDDAVATAITGTGVLNLGSIATGFGAIDVGADAITTSGTIGTAGVTTITGGTGTFSGALAANGGITFDNPTDTLGAHTLAGTQDANSNLILNIGNGGTDFTAGGGLTLAGSFLSNGDVTLGDAATDGLTFIGELRGGTPLMFEGATNNDVRTTFAFTDPTTNRTITFPDSTGTVLLDSNISGDAAVTSSGVLTVQPSAITNTKLANSSVSLALGTSGTDINWQASSVALGGTATLNLPDAGGSARGLVTTGAQTFAGDKTFSGTINLPGGGAISNFTCCGNSTWIDMPTTGASGIGSGGAGSNPWIAYVPSPGAWFSDAVAGDIAYRNTAGRLLFGNSSGNASTIISSSGLTLRSTSTTEFNVQNASSVDVFNIDSTNNRIVVGPAAGAATPTLLVVGIGTSAGDPTGTDGAIYYNSSSANFRCYENGAWRNCLGALSVAKTADQNVTNSSALTDATDLSFPVAANGYYTFTAVIAFNAPNTTADIRWSIAAATATAINVAGEAPLANGSATATSACSLITSNTNCDVARTASGRGVMRISGFVQNGATPGTVQFRFAQRIAVAGQSVTIYKGSSMSYQLTQ
ncbi:MAG: hypothetical protein AAB462_03565 [Patescibacteria group bacterium]